MNKKLVIAGGAAVLLVGIIFIIFSSNDELAEVIHEVENEVAEGQRMDALESTSTDDSGVGVVDEDSGASQQTIAQPRATVPATNSVVLGEVEGGNTISVPRATLLQPGYIVIYRINSNGETSLAGKSGLLEAGTHTNIDIQLAATAIYRQALVAVLHGDDGDGKFEYPGADLYLLNGGLLANDIDVVDIKRSDRESKVLETQVEAFLETNFMD
jgi:hypothetical protein